MFSPGNGRFSLEQNDIFFRAWRIVFLELAISRDRYFLVQEYFNRELTLLDLKKSVNLLWLRNAN